MVSNPGVRHAYCVSLASLGSVGLQCLADLSPVEPVLAGGWRFLIVPKCAGMFGKDSDSPGSVLCVGGKIFGSADVMSSPLIPVRMVVSIS